MTRPGSRYSWPVRPGTVIMPNLGGLGEKSLYDQWSEGVSEFLSDPFKKNVFTTAYNYYAPSASTPSPSASAGSRYYAEGGYAYLFDGANIWIVSSPASAAQVQVKPGTAAYNAIRSQIQSGAAKQISPETLKTMRAARRSPATPTAPAVNPTVYQQVPYAPQAPTTSANAPAPGGLTLSDKVGEYAPWLVLGGGAIIAIGLVLTAPKKGK